MIGRLYNRARKEREREKERELRRPQEEAARQQRLRIDEFWAIMESDKPWGNTRRIRCGCGNTVRFSIPEFPITFKCTKCGGRQTLLR